MRSGNARRTEVYLVCALSIYDDFVLKGWCERSYFLDRDFAGRAAWSPGRPWWSQGQGAQAHSTHTHHNFDFCVTDTHVHATEFVTDTHICAHRNLVTATAHASSISDQELVDRHRQDDYSN